MKQFIAATIFLLSLHGYSQTSVKVRPNSAAALRQYIWSYAKNSTKQGEKPLVDFDVMDNWRGLGRYLSMSDDGKYFAYTVNKMEFNDSFIGLLTVDSLVVQSTKNGQRAVFPGLKPGLFSADNKQYIFSDENSLCFLELSGLRVRKITDVASYKISQNKWLAYQLKDKERLYLRNLTTRNDKQFEAIAGYSFSNNGDWLICQGKNRELTLYGVSTKKERKYSDVNEYLIAENGGALLLKTAVGDTKTALDFIALPEGNVRTIWSGSEKADVKSYRFDASGKQILFRVVENGAEDTSGIWYYSAGMDKAVLKVTPKSLSAKNGLRINSFSFSDNGRYIQLSTQVGIEPPGAPNPDIAGVEVWNYKDINIQPIQQAQMKSAETYNAIIDIENEKLVFVESDDKKLSELHGDFVLVKKDYQQLLGDRFWENKLYKDSTWIVSLKDGRKHVFPLKAFEKFWFSPDGNWFVYLDANNGFHYYSYNLGTGIVNDISSNVPGNQFGFKDRLSDNGILTSGTLAAWVENDSNILVYDGFDIWKLDLTGKHGAVNITNGFGRANNTILCLLTTGRLASQIPTVKENESLVLRGFNTASKQSGFYKKDCTKAGSPEVLYSGQYFIGENYDWYDINVLNNMGHLPLKAKYANSWIVQRQSTNDAPNYFETKDFKNFKRLTNFQPQKKIQWFTAELVSFKHVDGTDGQGILYKPENFDPNKKYPVIIPFYGGFADGIYQFRFPAYMDQAMEAGKSPLWFLNNGFLVFTPDMANPSFKSGPKGFSCIEGAAKYLKQLPYIDATKLAFASHSARAQKGAYLFTHSTTFAAAALTEGVAIGNVINMALSYKMNKVGAYWLKVAEEGRGGANFWENKDIWLDETTVINADKARAPLLLLSDKNSAGSEEQIGQIFTSLRRLSKKAWWLKYDNGSHVLGDLNELKDYTIRYTQFFDHYLKNAPAPTWMTQGVPFKLKGIDSRLDLDPHGTCTIASGEPCLICEAWNAQYERTPAMFTKPIVEWNLDKDIAHELEQRHQEKRKQLDKEGEVQRKEVMRMLNK